MEQYKYDERNGLWYELQGDYYIPCLTVPESPKIGIWGQLRRKYLREHRKSLYTAMLLSDKLNSHLEEIDRSALQMFEQLIKQHIAAEGLTEDVKAADQMVWVMAMNRIRNAAAETVLNELIYS